MATKLSKKISTPLKPVKKETSQKPELPGKMITPKDFVYAVGRRRSSTARVRLFKGKEEILINGIKASQYWPGEDMKSLYNEIFHLTNTLGQYTATAKIKGSGKMGQLGAFNHALARAFDKLDKDSYHSALKKRGLLTRDPRMKETRKVGQGGKARFKKQSPKR